MKKYFYLYFFEIELLLLIIQIFFFILFFIKYNTEHLIKKYVLKRSNSIITYNTTYNSFNKKIERNDTNIKLPSNPPKPKLPPRTIIEKKEEYPPNENDIINTDVDIDKKKEAISKIRNLIQKKIQIKLFNNWYNISKKNINNDNINNPNNDNIENPNNDKINDPNNINIDINTNNDDENNLPNDSVYKTLKEIKDKKTYFKNPWFFLKNQMISFSIFITNDYNIYILKLSLFLFYINLIIYLNNLYNLFADNKTCEDDKYEFRIEKFFLSSIIPILLALFLRQLITTQNYIFKILEIKKEKSLIDQFKNIYNKLILIYFLIIFIFLIINMIISIERYNDCEGKLYYELYDLLLQFLFGTFFNFLIVVCYLLIKSIF